MAIANIVRYDSTFKYELQHPVTGEGLGVFFTLRSSSSPEVKAVLRRQADYYQEQERKNRKIKIEVLEKQARSRLAAAIVSWDWGGKELHEGEGVLELTPENIDKALEVDWIFGQINKQVEDIENFT